jgi:hypothetical protein
MKVSRTHLAVNPTGNAHRTVHYVRVKFSDTHPGVLLFYGAHVEIQCIVLQFQWIADSRKTHHTHLANKTVHDSARFESSFAPSGLKIRTHFNPGLEALLLHPGLGI